MLIGEYVELRLIEERDLGILVTWRNDPANWNQFFNKFPLSDAGQRRWFSSLLEDSSRKLFVICVKEEDIAIGTLGLDHIDFPNQTAELGNVLIGESRFRGKGYASEALELLLEYAFGLLNLNRLYLKVFVDNARAARLYEKYGFRQEGILREAVFAQGHFKDVQLMGLLRREFCALRRA